MRLLGLGLAAVVGVVVGNACLLDLEHEIACGDGWVDEDAGEECDPAVRSSWEGKCLTSEGTHDAVCHPTACVLLLGEADCALCGNGVVDEGEECDPKQDGIDDFALGIDCKGLAPSYSDTPYSSGTTRRCLEDCTWDRKECGFCGNDAVDGAEPVWVSDLQSGLESRAEACDGDRFDPYALSKAWSPFCLANGAVSRVACEPNCLDLVDLGGGCCLPPDAECPGPDDLYPCCYALDHPGVDPCVFGTITTDDTGADPPDADSPARRICL